MDACVGTSPQRLRHSVLGQYGRSFELVNCDEPVPCKLGQLKCKLLATNRR